MDKHIKTISIFIAVIVCIPLGYVSVMAMGEYGFLVFVFIPLLIGFIPSFIVGRKQPLRFGECLSLGFLSLLFACLLMLALAFEGLICILMASPLLLIFTLLGSYFGYLYSRYFQNKLKQNQLFLLLTLSTLGLISFDTLTQPNELIPATTIIEINAPIETVWENVVSFSTIEEPAEWFFKTGIAYPIDAKIDGEGVGAVRYCNFTTGSFVEPITTWDAPTLLQFDVEKHPVPMHEWNPFWEVHPPHLNGYFQSRKGEFRLVKIDENRTELQGTTWYTVDINPQFYWTTWSDAIVHRIHHRVLKHIKKESEK